MANFWVCSMIYKVTVWLNFSYNCSVNLLQIFHFSFHTPCALVICCLTSNAYHPGYAFSTTRLLKTKRSIILSDFQDFWFEDFSLLVTDVIKPPGTYFNNNIDCRINLIVHLRSSALFSLLPAFFCMLRWIQFESQQSVCN